MSRKGFLALAVILCATVLVSLAEAGPRIEGLYRLQFDPLAGNPAQALRPGEAVSSAGSGELLLISGRGFSQGVEVLFNNLAVSPVAAPPFSNQQQLVVAVPEMGPQTVKVAVQTGEGRSNELTLTIQGTEQEGDRESYATFRAIDEFLFLAEEAIRVSLEELPITFQWLATETVELLNRDRLLALKIEGGLSSLSHSESKLLDGLFVSVGLRPLLEGYIHSWQDGIADVATLEGVRRTMEYKGSALKAVGEFLGQVTVTVWGGSEVTSAAQQDLGSYFRALGELNQNLAGNVAFLAKLLDDAAWHDRWLTLSQGIGDLTLGLGVLEKKLDDPNYGLEALQGKIDRLDYSLKLTLNSSMSRLESWLREIAARLDNQVSPSLAEILARLDSPQYGLAEIKAEVMTIESQMTLTVLPGLEELLRRQGAEQMLSHEAYGLRAIKAELDRVEAKLDDPQHGLAEIKAEIRALEMKVDKIWKCLSGMTFTFEERPAEVERAAVDVILAIDSSGSMKTNDPRRMRITTARQFVEQLDPQRDRAGVVSWDNDIDFVQPLTDDLSQVEERIERADASGATNLNAGLSTAIDEFVRGRPGVEKVIIFLTDGDGTYTFSGQLGSPVALAAQKGIKIYAIGLGSAPARRKLEDMADTTGGRFYLAPTAADLQDIYAEISEQLIVPAERVLKMTCPID